jgi:Zn-dependent protease
LGFDLQSLLQRAALYLPPLILSLSFHEWAHAWSAWKLGDDTAARMGRLTLNPLAHVDPIGTVLFPLLGVPFGWARPVPVNPARFRRGVNMNTGMMITAAAGPISNIVLATVFAVVLGGLARFAPSVLGSGGGVVEFIAMMIRVNVALAIFNLLPIPPLDGSRVVAGLIPYSLRDAWDRFSRFAAIGLLLLLFLGGGTVARIISGPSNLVLSLLQRLVYAIA